MISMKPEDIPPSSADSQVARWGGRTDTKRSFSSALATTASFSRLAPMQAIISTPHGDITINLFDKTAPNTVANFVKLAQSGFYNELAFHRVINNFMIQGGCPNSKAGAAGIPGTGGPGYKIKCETGASNPEKHAPGTLSMAHAGPNTGGSQFFVTHTSTPHLDGVHTVFGRVATKADLDIVNKVKQGDRFSIKIVE